MYWSYLVNFEKENDSNKFKNKILTFEKKHNIEKLKLGYCELILDNYFEGFKPFDHIIISEYGPLEDPLNNENKFILKFNDFEKAKLLLGNNN